MPRQYSTPERNRTRSSWSAMKDRCLNPNNHAYMRYAGRGITICQRWMEFDNFRMDMGDRPSGEHSLDRYPDKNGNYEPDNCRWATRSEQNRNRCNNTIITFENETLLVVEWEARLGFTVGTLAARLRRGWPVGLALTAPLGYQGLQRSERTDTRVIDRIREAHKWSDKIKIAPKARAAGLDPSTVRRRLDIGWSLEEALRIPVLKHRSRTVSGQFLSAADEARLAALAADEARR